MNSRPPGFRGQLFTQIFSSFYKIYSSYYVGFLKVTGLAAATLGHPDLRSMGAGYITYAICASNAHSFNTSTNGMQLTAHTMTMQNDVPIKYTSKQTRD